MDAGEHAAPFVGELGVLPASAGGALVAWSVTPPPGANGVATVTVPAGTPTVKLRRAGYAEGEVGVR